MSDGENEFERDLENKLAEASKEVEQTTESSVIAQMRALTATMRTIDRELQAIDEEVGLRIAAIRKRLGSLT